MTAADDRALMTRALAWAERGRGRTSPNPFVGAVVVTPDGIVVGQGATSPPGGRHAEVVALDAAGDRARGGTLYVTLEPCAHTGRTPPCAPQIVAAGISRVVVAVADPNPLVAGRGVAHLREHGVAVDVGVGAKAAGEQHRAFFTWVTRRRPLVIAKTAVSADGFVGPGDRPVRLTGPEVDRYFHRQRAEVDAIAVGSGTVLVDDPLLTPREVFRSRPLIRVVFDWRARVTPAARLFSTLASGPVIMVTTADAARHEPARLSAIERLGVEVRTFGTRGLAPVLEWLAGRGVTSLLVEGGPALHQALADADLVDRVQLAMTPALLQHGVLAAPVFRRASGMPGRFVGADRLVECDVHGTG